MIKGATTRPVKPFDAAILRVAHLERNVVFTGSGR